MVMDLDLNHLSYFYEVARRGGFTQAARFLRFSQPAISKAVKLLEDREGVRLMERSREGTRLTDEGTKLFEFCEGMFQNLENTRNQIKSESKGCEGQLSLGASDNF